MNLLLLLLFPEKSFILAAFLSTFIFFHESNYDYFWHNGNFLHSGRKNKLSLSNVVISLQHRSHVPQLNKWGDNNDVPYGEYTEYPVNARKGRAKNSQLSTDSASPLHNVSDPDVPKSKQEFTPSRDGEHLQLNEPGRTRRVSGGADHSVDRSPLHTRQQGRSTSHSYTPNSSSSTPGRAKARPSGRGGDPPVRSPIAPAVLLTRLLTGAQG